MTDVDLVVNCYERTYRKVLRAGAMNRKRFDHGGFAFAEVTVLINNVRDRDEAEEYANAMKASGEITRYFHVSDLLPGALETTGMRTRDIRRLPHFTDCCLTALTLPGPDWMLYWDADAEMSRPVDWVGPTIEKMLDDDSLAIGNPNNWHEGLALRESLWSDRDFAIGYGFSDVAFLARRSELAQPVYRYAAPASWRYPLAAVEPIFEQRVDAYMRRRARLRATFLDATVTHPASVGTNYPDLGLRERIRGAAQRRIAAVADRVDHPALRAWPNPEAAE